MITCSYISLGGLQLLPSESFCAALNGILDFNKELTESELYYDGSFFGSSKISSKDLTLYVIVKHQFNLKEIQAEQQLNYILKQENIKLQFKLEEDNNLYECIVNCTARANSADEITATLHLSDPNIYKQETTKELTKAMSGGFYFTSSGFTILADGFEFSETVIGNQAEIINNGDTIYPFITIKGDVTDIKIKNETTGETLHINYPLSNNDVLTVDCSPSTRKVRLNDRIPLMKYKTGSYITLINGSNILTVDYTGDCTVFIKYKEVL